MAVTITDSPDRMSYQIVAHIEKALDVHDNASMIRQAMKDMAQAFAEEWAIDNLDAIYKEINAKAIANLIMIEVANQVKDNIVKKEEKK